MPLVATATNYFSKRIHDRFEKVQEYFGTVSNRAQESLAGVRVIRAYTQEKAEIESFKQHLRPEEIPMFKPLDAAVTLDAESIAGTDCFCELDHV